MRFQIQLALRVLSAADVAIMAAVLTFPWLVANATWKPVFTG
jgi:hypothetical protein